MVGQDVSCPQCSISLTVPQFGIPSKAPQHIQQPKQSSGMFKGLGKTFERMLDVIFDRKSVEPPDDSPYKAIIGIIYFVYVVIMGSVFVVTIIGVLASPFVSIKEDWWKVTGFVTALKVIGFGIGKGVGVSLLAFCSFWISWLFIHIPYKIVRVIFDIAEYTRQINNRKTVL